MHVQAFHRGLFAPRYVIITIGWLREFWWNEGIEEGDLNCTAAQRQQVLSFSLAVSDEIFLDLERDADVVTTPGIVRHLNNATHNFVYNLFIIVTVKTAWITM